MSNNLFKKYRLCVVGGIIGGFIGYFYRPSALLVGQLPFMDVISRGKTLKGLDQILIPIAERSFNYMVIGTLLGATIGYILTIILLRNK